MISSAVQFRMMTAAIVLFTTLASAPFGHAQQSPARVVLRPICVYDFKEGNGRIIQDRSGHDDAIDLQIETPDSVRWSSGVLRVVSSASSVSQRSAKRLSDSVRESNAISIEAWITPANTEQTGPARIVSLSSNPGTRNFTLGQNKDVFDVRLRTTNTDGNGNPSTATPEKSLTTELSHVVFTRDKSGAAVLFVNGQQVVSQLVGGDLGNWEAGHRLSFANEVSCDRPWLGEFHFVAIYDQVLSPG